MESLINSAEVSTEPWPDGLYPLSVRGRDSQGRYMQGASVTISPQPASALAYDTRQSIAAETTLPKRVSQFNALVPPGVYQITFSTKHETKTFEATVKDPIGLTQSSDWKDGKPFYFRDHRWDRYIIKENSYSAVTVSPDDLVIDVGAHIGVFTRSSLSKRATVISYEPDRDNHRLLTMNASAYADRSQIVRAAVVASDSDFAREGSASLWIDADGTGDSSRSALHSLYRTRGARLPVNVPVACWDEIFDQHSPTILKVDVEGAELTYDWSALKKCSRLAQVALEIENKGKDRERKQSIIDNLAALNFTMIKETNGWSTVQIWKR